MVQTLTGGTGRRTLEVLATVLFTVVVGYALAVLATLTARLVGWGSLAMAVCILVGYAVGRLQSMLIEDREALRHLQLEEARNLPAAPRQPPMDPAERRVDLGG